VSVWNLIGGNPPFADVAPNVGWVPEADIARAEYPLPPDALWPPHLNDQKGFGPFGVI
jgi:hypothetical protein